MRRTPDLHEQDREPDDRAPSSDHARPGRPFPTTQGHDDDDEPTGVAHRRSRAPLREQEEEDVADEDIIDVLDDDEIAVEG